MSLVHTAKVLGKLSLLLRVMKEQIEYIARSRNNLLEQLRELSVEELNSIPPGYNNNIIWNLGHLIAAQQGICYMRSTLPTYIEDSLFSAYKPGSRPERNIDQQEIDSIRELFVSTVRQLNEDYDNKIFNGYKPWTTRNGFEIRNIEEAISFVLFHEGHHGGVISSFKRLVQKK